MDLKEAKIREIVAFTLANLEAFSAVPSGSELPGVLDDCRSVWRSLTHEERESLREIGDEFHCTLAEFGLDIVAVRQKQLNRAVDNLITVPASKAYDLAKLPGVTGADEPAE